MDKILGIVAVAIAVFAFATAIVPKWRRTVFWKGTGVRAGVVTSIGFGTIAAAAAVLLFVHRVIPDRHKIWLAVFILVGITCTLIGKRIDFPRRERNAHNR